MSLALVKITDCPSKPNTMLDKADNIMGKSDLDSAANKGGHRYLTLVSTSTMAVDHP
jgi:hypothetical protein